MPSVGIVKGKKRSYEETRFFLGEPSRDTETSDKVQPYYGVFQLEKHIDPGLRINKRASDSPMSETLGERSAYPKKPIVMSSESEWRDNDLEAIASRVRKRKKASIKHLNTIGKDVCWPTVTSQSHSDDEVLVRSSPSKIRKPRSQSSRLEPNLYPRPLNHMDLDSSVLKASGRTAQSKNCLSKIKDHGKHNLFNFTAQEGSATLYPSERKIQRKYSSGLKPVESVESDDGQKFTYYWSSSEIGSDESSGSQMPNFASASLTAVSLIDQLRQAAAERRGRVSASDIPVSKKKIRKSTSVSSMSESISGYSEQPSRSPPEVSDDCGTGGILTPEEGEQKTEIPPASIIDRKRLFVYSPPPDLVLAKIQYVVDTYNLFEEDLEGDDCWLHPFPPAPLFNRHHQAVQRNFYWTNRPHKHALTANFGVVILLVKDRLTEMQKQGYINSGWQVSRTCGNWTCCNWRHCTMESKQASLTRRHCFMSFKSCGHNPPCSKDKKCYPQSAAAKDKQSRQPIRSSVASSVPKAKSISRCPRAPPPKKASPRREYSPLPTPSPSTRFVTLESSLHTPNHSQPIQDTTKDKNTFEIGENSNLHNQSYSPSPNSIASRAFGVFQPAAQSFKSAFRAVRSLLPYTPYQVGSQDTLKSRTCN